MSIQRTDVRFLLPRSPRRVVLLPGADAWRDPLEQARVEVVPAGAEADLAVAPAERVAEALATGAETVVLEGHAALRREGMALLRVLPLPGLDRPLVGLPLGQPGPARYVLDHWLGRVDWRRRVLNRIAAPGLGHGLAPPKRDQVTIGMRRPGPPFLLAAAAPLGVPADASFFWTGGEADTLSRGALFVFAAEDSRPSWVIKFARLPGYTAPFERDERGLAVAAEAGGTVAAHAPRLLGRVEVDGLHGSVETAAQGMRLATLLASAAPYAEKAAAIERVATWIVEVGAQTRAPWPALVPGLERLRSVTLPAWTGGHDTAALVAGLDGLPAVVEHDDLGTWNILVDGDELTAID